MTGPSCPACLDRESNPAGVSGLDLGACVEVVRTVGREIRSLLVSLSRPPGQARGLERDERFFVTEYYNSDGAQR